MNASAGQERDPFDKVMDQAEALHEAAVEAVRPELKPVADNLLRTILRHAKARPLSAILIAGAVGFVIASMTAR